MVAATLLGTVSPGFAVEVQYPDGPVRLCSLPYPVTIEGHAFDPGAALGSVSRIEQGSENRSYGFTLQASGIPPEFAAYLRSQDPHGGRVVVWFLLVDNTTHALIGARRIRTGRVDTQDVTAGDTLSVSINVEAFNLDWERPRRSLVTDQSQRDAYPGDLFFKYVSALPSLNLSWGRT
jgi:hypothetical protein